jgi:hypothetical protein
VDSHPEVAYRFEPFHRLGKQGRLTRIRRDAEADRATAETLTELYDALLPANPVITRAPFYPKTNRRTFGIEKVWALARASKLGAPLYRVIYTPGAGAPVVFKEVTLEGLMERLVLDAGLRAVYLIRHPCAVVSSFLRGQARGLMPFERRRFLPERLRRDDPGLWARVGQGIESLSPAEQEALLWRLDVSVGFRLAMEDPRVLLIVYEDLCRRPKEVASSVFGHFNLSMTDQSERAIDETTSGADAPKRDKWSDRYFTVFRDPLAASERWRTELDKANQRAILALVSDAPVYRFALEQGLWE